MRAAFLLALIGCQSTPNTVPCPETHHEAPKPMPAFEQPVIIDAAAPVETDTNTDTYFQTEVKAFAERTNRDLVGWGTLHFDGTDKKFRYAAIVVREIPEHQALNPFPYEGGYIIQTDEYEYWFVATWWTSPLWGMSDPLAWEDHADNRITHKQLHNHGEEELEFAMRDHEIVVLKDFDYSSRDDTRENRQFATKSGTCPAKRCPPFASYSAQGIGIKLAGPTATIATLPQPILQ
ncbi:MAG: hypothetical protein QM831_36915 [Kofleriaceae bacterium]